MYSHIKEKHKIRSKNNVIRVIYYYIQKLFKYIFKSTLNKKSNKKK